MVDTWGGEFIDDIRYGPQRSGAWHGEHETYGTEQQFIEGEKLQDLMPQDTSWGMRPTYSNPVAEFIGENPLMNLAVDARGILSRGGGPTGLDWAMLGLSGLPIVAPSFKDMTILKRSIQDWGKRQNKYVDWDVDKYTTATSDATFKPTGFRDTLQGRILERLGMLPEYKDMSSVADTQDILKMGTDLKNDLGRISRNLELEDIVRNNYTRDMLEEGMSLKQINKNLDDAFKQAKLDWDSPLQSSQNLPTDVARLSSAKPIQDMTWREWDDLSDSAFQLSSKQHGMMRAQGITDPDDVLDHFWGRGARDDFVGWLEEAIAKTNHDYSQELEFVRLRDLKSGYADKMTSKQFADDIAWAEIEVEAQKIVGTEPMVVAQKMSWKPDNVSHEHWAQFTKDMTMKEVERAARKLALRIVD